MKYRVFTLSKLSLGKVKSTTPLGAAKKLFKNLCDHKGLSDLSKCKETFYIKDLSKKPKRYGPYYGTFKKNKSNKYSPVVIKKRKSVQKGGSEESKNIFFKDIDIFGDELWCDEKSFEDDINKPFKFYSSEYFEIIIKEKVVKKVTYTETYIIDINKGEIIKTYDFLLKNFFFIDDKQFIYSRGKDIYLYNKYKSNDEELYSHENCCVTALFYSKDLKKIASGSTNSMIRIYDLTERKIEKTLKYREDDCKITSIYLSRDTILASYIKENSESFIIINNFSKSRSKIYSFLKKSTSKDLYINFRNIIPESKSLDNENINILYYYPEINVVLYKQGSELKLINITSNKKDKLDIGSKEIKSEISFFNEKLFLISKENNILIIDTYEITSDGFKAINTFEFDLLLSFNEKISSFLSVGISDDRLKQPFFDKLQTILDSNYFYNDNLTKYINHITNIINTSFIKSTYCYNNKILLNIIYYIEIINPKSFNNSRYKLRYKLYSMIISFDIKDMNYSINNNLKYISDKLISSIIDSDLIYYETIRKYEKSYGELILRNFIGKISNEVMREDPELMKTYPYDIFLENIIKMDNKYKDNKYKYSYKKYQIEYNTKIPKFIYDKYIHDYKKEISYSNTFNSHFHNIYVQGKDSYNDYIKTYGEKMHIHKYIFEIFKNNFIKKLKLNDKYYYDKYLKNISNKDRKYKNFEKYFKSKYCRTKKTCMFRERNIKSALNNLEKKEELPVSGMAGFS
jgi:hypothetical protein